ncbi:MAG TPA: hypothetical protein DD723_10270 [Candidatus Omnitrophica bacterium]|uniref:Membrane-fusion protein n=1 Tax=Candidatus Kaiserbacteria bacterium GW2011_GWA2_49_19 TaxID=1618669 RepID=A0A0G1VPF3_9BACT|nr:MAG: membrane-fusion protein [Candidatus Kaiserbacteria bacterium GW2011_GWA2_49_19]HBR15902.1 hypothetical protein [Candidatus Omnitrophota bacterium]
MKMDKRNILIVLLLIALTAVVGVPLIAKKGVHDGHRAGAAKEIYYCPMHPEFTSDRPGDCPICGMSLVKKEEAPAAESRDTMSKDRAKKILFYRHPMRPDVTSPVPNKDDMGMEYVPVYEEEDAGEGILISLEKQQSIGVKQDSVMKRRLTHQIRTVGRVAYDPELFVAQQEYLQALKVQESTKDSTIPLIKEQMGSFVEAAGQKLLLLGMSPTQIEELAAQGNPQSNLYLPLDQETVWVYMTIYEYEMSFIKEGLSVEIEAIAFPGETFEGKISAIMPVLDAMTRSVKVRAEIKNTHKLLKPDMFVNAKIQIDLGEKLAVPQDAVMDTGERKIVFVAAAENRFQARNVRLGSKAGGFYEVLEGLTSGERVVTSGNFLIDSESRLQSAISGGHQHGE